MSASAFAQTWSELQKIVASDRNSGYRFGYSVAISGDYAIVGSPLDDFDELGNNFISRAGSAFIFEKDAFGNWNQVAKIVASGRSFDSQFGWSVDISGTRAIVGAYNHAITGAAYIFDRDFFSGAWTESVKLTRAAPVSDRFGWSVAVDGSYALVGAFQNTTDETGNNPLSSAGAVYVYRRGLFSWSEHQKFVASDRSGDDNFGISVAMDGTFAIIGSNRDEHDASGINPVGLHAGSAYFFERSGPGSTYVQVRKVTASNRTSSDEFGWSVDISGTRAIVSCNDDNEDISNGNILSDAGTAYIYERDPFTGWALDQHLEASDRNANAQFGWSVAIDNDYAIVGAVTESNDQNGMNTLANAGASYIYERDAGGTWLEEDKIVHSDRFGGDNFGNAVCISGLNAIIGARFEDEDALGANTLSSAGSAYIFERSVILPIHFLAFNLQQNDAGVRLIWQVDHGSSTTHFDIQRSADGSIFESIGVESVDHGKSNYSFIDENPLIGQSYYRLAINSSEGMEHSEVLTTYRNDADIIIQPLYPNPVHVNLTIPVFVKNTTELQIIIQELQGRPVYERREMFLGGQHQLQTDVSNLAAGLYQLIIIHEEAIIHQSSFIKQ